MKQVQPTTVFIPVPEDYEGPTSGYVHNSGQELAQVIEHKAYVFNKADLSMLLTDTWCNAIEHLRDIVQKSDYSKNRKEYINNLLK